MKLWKKIYLLTMLITTLSVNIGFFGIVYFTYEYMLLEEKKRCEAEFEVVYGSLGMDMAQMQDYISLETEYFEKILKVYNSYFEEDTQMIGIVDGVILGDASISGTLSLKNGVYLCDEENTTVYCIQSLPESQGKYGVIMKRTLFAFDNIWDTLWPLYIAGGVILSLLVSFVLAMVVRKILKPLDELEHTAKRLECKDWSARAEVKGNNELAQLGRQFNAMAESIEENIKKLEHQSKQMQQLIHNLAHEMNTPITSIGGFADYMQMSTLSEEEQQECLTFIRSESNRIKDISSTILAMAELEHEDMFKTKFSMKNLCNRLEVLYQKQFQRKGISFYMYCMIEEMTGNEVLIESLLRNLITNAYHALLDKKEGVIQVEVWKEKEQIKLQVSDNGCGMGAEEMKQIFEPFYRVDKARSRNRGGSGLGLAFCKRIAENHNGWIEVVSEYEKGTQFIVNFTVS